jgi:hypothetical protein
MPQKINLQIDSAENRRTRSNSFDDKEHYEEKPKDKRKRGRRKPKSHKTCLVDKDRDKIRRMKSGSN